MVRVSDDNIFKCDEVFGIYGLVSWSGCRVLFMYEGGYQEVISV